jgi:hypothetical protein
MSNQTTDNFLSVWNNLPEHVIKFPTQKLYYDDEGRPIDYTIEDREGNYVEVDGPTYMQANMNVRVRDGKIVELSAISYKKLKPSSTGTACVDEDVTIVAPVDYPNQTLWRLVTNEY